MNKDCRIRVFEAIQRANTSADLAEEDLAKEIIGIFRDVLEGCAFRTCGELAAVI